MAEKDENFRTDFGTPGESNANKQPVSSQPKASTSGNGNGTGNGGGGAPGGQNGQYVTRITNCAREDEMDDNLGAVSNILGDLKNMAQDMGEEIGRQNKQVERITDKVRPVDHTVTIAFFGTSATLGNGKLQFERQKETVNCSPV